MPVTFSGRVLFELSPMELVKNAVMLTMMKRIDASKKPVLFSIRFVTLDRMRNTGGEIIELNDVQLAAGLHTLPVTERREAIPVFRKKLPDDWKTGIIKIYNPTTGRIISVRHRLIVAFKLKTDASWKDVRL